MLGIMPSLLPPQACEGRLQTLGNTLTTAIFFDQRCQMLSLLLLARVVLLLFVYLIVNGIDLLAIVSNTLAQLDRFELHLEDQEIGRISRLQQLAGDVFLTIGQRYTLLRDGL